MRSKLVAAGFQVSSWLDGSLMSVARDTHEIILTPAGMYVPTSDFTFREDVLESLAVLGEEVLGVALGGGRTIMNAISIENLKRTYGATGAWGRRLSEVHALRGISLQVSKGEVFGILGPNGAGKTTMLKVLTTLITPSAGKVEVLGFDVQRQPTRIRPRINAVFGGERSHYWRLTGRENLQYFAELYRVTPHRQRTLIPELMDLAGLTAAADRRVETYSRGMRQVLAIVRGLINNPEVLFLDEPSIGLDPVLARRVRQLFLSLAAGGVTVVLTTHQMAEAEALCDRISIVLNGRLHALDTPAELKRLTVGLSVVELIMDALPDSAGDDIAALPGVAGVNVISLGSRVMVQVPTEDPEVTAGQLAGILPKGFFSITRVREANLEDAYVKIVGGYARC